MPPVAIVPPAPKESLRVWRNSYETSTTVFTEEQAIALLPAYCNRNDAERTAAKDVATKYKKGKLSEALDALVEIVDGPARPHEDAERFFKYTMKNESIFEAMYALQTLAKKAEITSTAVIAQKFLSIIPTETRTAVLKDAEGKAYIEIGLEKLLVIARREDSLRAPTKTNEQRASTSCVQVVEHQQPTASFEPLAASQPPQWFTTAMDSVVHRLSDLEVKQDNGQPFRRNQQRGLKRGKHPKTEAVKCRNCRTTGHFVKQCPQRFCQACGQRGHDSWMELCPNYHL